MKTLKEQIENLEKEIAEKKAELKKLKSQRDNFELEPDDFSAEYDYFLNDCYGEFMGYNADYILKNVDPIAYRRGLLDFVDGKII